MVSPSCDLQAPPPRSEPRRVGEQDCIMLYAFWCLLLEATMRRSGERCAWLVERGVLRQNSALRIHVMFLREGFEDQGYCAHYGL